MGDPVRFFLLTENPSSQRHKFWTHSVYVPRTWPIRASYSGYGVIEDWEEDANVRTWMSGFRIDLHEMGVGDNSCHDVATSKTMSFDAMLNAVDEGRMFVKRKVGFEECRPLLSIKNEDSAFLRENLLPTFNPKKKTPVGVPTLRRVCKKLRVAGLQVNIGCFQDGLLVDATVAGRIRVRGADIAQLAKAQARLGEYATMIEHDSGPNAQTATLLVSAKPGAGRRVYEQGQKKRHLKVEGAMIREDVWQHLCAMSPFDSWGGKTRTIEIFFREAQESWKEMTSKGIGGLASILIDGTSAFPYGNLSLGNHVGLSAHWQLMALEYLAGKMTDHEAFLFKLDAAEFMYITQRLASLRYMWRPSYTNGPQDGDWPAHEEFHARMMMTSRERTPKDDLLWAPLSQDD